MVRSLTFVAVATVAAGLHASSAFAQTAGQNVAPPADLHPPINLDADTLRARFTSDRYSTC